MPVAWEGWALFAFVIVLIVGASKLFDNVFYDALAAARLSLVRN